MNDLIFDLGFFNGDDTAYYLHHGYTVVAVEANPALFALGQKRFDREIREGRLHLLNNAFSDSNEQIRFYINPLSPDQSTCDGEKVKWWGVNPIITDVQAITYHNLITVFGLPFYIKCDIEGLDHILIKNISDTKLTPQYLSFELSRFDYYKIFSYLYTAGYSRFQLINQTALADEPDFKFTKYSSGSFGAGLPKDKWLTFDECLTRYMKYKELKGIDNVNLALGWVDVHAKL